MPGAIVVKGARVHNLKNIDLEIPRQQLVVVTGVSGSGKSSLAFDTLYAEGQRRYLESLSTGTRQLLQQLDKPDVDSIDGLSPAVAVRQRSATSGPRSMVATVTDIYDYLRLLFVRVGQPVCVGCGMLISVQTIQEIVDQLLGLPAGTRVVLLAPVTGANKTGLPKLLRELAAQGFTRIRIDGELRELSQGIRLEGDFTGGLDVVIDRLVIREGVEKRLADSLEVASRVGRQFLKAEVQSPASTEPPVELRFSRQYACVNCGSPFPELTLGLFSFNSPLGACPGCAGSGRQRKPTDKGEHIGQDAEPACRVCNGLRLKRESLAVRLADKNIAQVTALPISHAIAFLASLHFADQHKIIAAHLLGEIIARLRSLTQLGLDYLSLDRPLSTLSTGEAQRVRLATQIGFRLTGVLYILDEPSLGLHQKDNAELLKLLKILRDAGNSVLVVEHDPDIILSADYVIDMGPGAGLAGGQIVSQGTAIELMADPLSATGRYLSRQKKIACPPKRRTGSGEFVVIQGARKNNLRDLTVEIPIGVMTCVTGVSGSGKSTLVSDILYDQVSRGLRGSRRRSGAQSAISGWQHFDRVVQVDQAPIGQTPRANPATYTGIHNHIRELYAQLPEARVRGYKADRFSFNSRAGQCAACRGEGLIRVDMYFLPDIFVTCNVCNGQRFNRETLDVRYKGRNIAEALQLTVVEAAELFGSITAVAERLRTLASVGLGYLRLDQPSHTLSGGEAQRLKLARELARRTRGRSLYVLDEPTAGLHFADVEQLLQLLHRLTDAGNTLVIVEHNLDVIKNADYIIDLGPGGGPNGGAIIARGTPEEVATVGCSDTGHYLARALDDSLKAGKC